MFYRILSLKAYFQVWENFLATESPLKLLRNAFYFTSKALFVLKLFKFLSWLFGHVAQGLDKKDKVNFQFYDAATCTHITQYTYYTKFREAKAIRQRNLVN